MKHQVYIGIDLGAESGRVMAGLWDGARMGLEELHRFANGPVPLADTLRWNVLALWAEIQNGLRIAGKRFGSEIVSIGVDTWGVDFVLIDNSGEMLGQPYHYRDSRTRGALDRAFRRVPRAGIFAQTGLQFMELNTLYQLIALQESDPALLEAADCLLLMPDFFHWALCGSRAAEFTIASTSQCLHPIRRDWSFDLLERFHIPAKIFPKIVPPGTELGRARPSVRDHTGLADVKVVAPPSHDTASAVAGAPSEHTGKSSWAYISSGTWSLMGVESQSALLSDRVLELNLTNEGGIDGTYRVLKNIAGLWLVQQCRRSFEKQGKHFDYAELTRLAAAAPAIGSTIDTEDARFLNPPDMAAAIQSFCRQTGQPVPETEGAIIRCALESLARKYSAVLAALEEVTGNRIDAIHIVGGGSRNQLLNQLAANACKRPVIAGPVEATVLGNLLVQARANGELGSLSQLRQTVRASAGLERFEPQATAAGAGG
jgi:rhamnulokinase